MRKTCTSALLQTLALLVGAATQGQANSLRGQLDAENTHSEVLVQRELQFDTEVLVPDAPETRPPETEAPDVPEETDPPEDEHHGGGTITQLPLPIIPDDPPHARSDSFDFVQGQGRQYVEKPGVLVNDSGSNGLEIFVSGFSINGGFLGSLDVKEDGSFKYEPSSTFVGSESFQYTVCYVVFPDFCSETSVTINVLEDPNRPEFPPLALDDNYDVKEGETLKVSSLGFLANDVVFAPFQPIFACDRGNSKRSTAGGRIDIDSDGSFEYQAKPCTTGSDSFTYRACYEGYDSVDFRSNLATVKINIKDNLPQKPDANDDTYYVNDGETLKVSKYDGFLDNDHKDSNRGYLKADRITKKYGFKGQLDTKSDGSFEYLSEAGYQGSFQFTYRACYTDWSCVDCDEATVTIVVQRNPNKPDHAPSYRSKYNPQITLGKVLHEDLNTAVRSDSRFNLHFSHYDTPNGTINGDSDGDYEFGNAPVGNTTIRYRVCYVEWPDLCRNARATITTLPIITIEEDSVDGNETIIIDTLPLLTTVGNADGESNVPGYPLQACQSDCDDDDECTEDLICFQRHGTEVIPGCIGKGADFRGLDFCVPPLPTHTLTAVVPTGTIYLKYVGNANGNFQSGFPLKECQADCDNDDECDGDLICFQRDGTEPVPGCLSDGNDYAGDDFCIRPFPNTYVSDSLIQRGGDPFDP